MSAVEGTAPELVVELADAASLILDPNNARRHNARNLETIAASLSRFGQRRPIVVLNDVVIAGNGTLEAARSLGWTRLAVTRLPDDWSPEEARAFAIADNRTSDLASWDYQELVDQLGEVNDDDLIRAAGFTDDEYGDLVARLQEGATDERDMDTGIRPMTTIQDYAARYADKTTRLLVCEYPNEVWLWANEHLQRLRTELNLPTNADAVLRVIEVYVGESPPEPGSGERPGDPLPEPEPEPPGVPTPDSDPEPAEDSPRAVPGDD